jgi:hypothetical protein
MERYVTAMRPKMPTLCIGLGLFLLTAQTLAADLKLTDGSGTTVVLSDASIDYGGFMTSDSETQGIRLMQGDGLVIVKWSDIETLTVTGRDDTVKPARVKLEIVLKGGKKVPAALARQGRMKLRGKTELGEYSLDLDKIRVITPQPPTGK